MGVESTIDADNVAVLGGLWAFVVMGCPGFEEQRQHILIAHAVVMHAGNGSASRAEKSSSNIALTAAEAATAAIEARIAGIAKCPLSSLLDTVGDTYSFMIPISPPSNVLISSIACP